MKNSFREKSAGLFSRDVILQGHSNTLPCALNCGRATSLLPRQNGGNLATPYIHIQYFFLSFSFSKNPKSLPAPLSSLLDRSRDSRSFSQTKNLSIPQRQIQRLSKISWPSSKLDLRLDLWVSDLGVSRAEHELV